MLIEGFRYIDRRFFFFFLRQMMSFKISWVFFKHITHGKGIFELFKKVEGYRGNFLKFKGLFETKY